MTEVVVPHETDPLVELKEAVGYRDLVEKMILVAVSDARAQGATWERIADSLGVTHQAARKRFKDKVGK